MTERESSSLLPQGHSQRTPHQGRSAPARSAPRLDEERLVALVHTQQAIAAADLDLHALVHLIVERVQQLTGASGAAIALAEGTSLVYHAAPGTQAGSGPQPQDMDLRHLPDDFLNDRTWRHDSSSAVAVEGGSDPAGAACSRLVLPLWHDEQLIGVLEVLSPLAHAFDEQEMHTLQLLEGLLAAVLCRARDFEAQRASLEQRTAELHDSEERFESAFTFSAFGMACVAPDGRLLQVNPALCTLFGCPVEELQDANLHALTHADDRGQHQVYFERLLQGELRSYQLEQRYQLSNGRTVWALASVSLVRGQAGKPNYLIAQFQDTTGHKRLQERCEELQKMESLARALGSNPADVRLDTGPTVTRPKRQRRRGKKGPAAVREELGPREWLFDGWYHRHGERLRGPFSRTELKEMLETGRLRGAERVWERWKRGPESFLVPTTARAACV